RTGRPLTSRSRSLTTRVRPCPGSYGDTAIVSTSTGTRIWRRRSARKGTEPLSTPTTTRPSAWSAVMAAPRRAQMAASSAWSAIDSSGAQAGRGQSGREVVAQVGAQEGGTQVVPQLGQRPQQLDGLLAGVRVALLEQG